MKEEIRGASPRVGAIDRNFPHSLARVEPCCYGNQKLGLFTELLREVNAAADYEFIVSALRKASPNC